MKNRNLNIALMKRHVKRGFRFKSGDRCFKLLSITSKHAKVFFRGLKIKIPIKRFYQTLNFENRNVFNEWRKYDEIIGN
jgi:hypothetical protein